MFMDTRGKINHVGRRQQIIDFSQLRYGNKTPTDVEGYLDFGNKATILFEMKLEGSPFPDGQRLALERLVDDIGSRKPALLIVADHAVYDIEQQIPAHVCLVREFRYRNKWYKGSSEYPMVKDLADAFLKKHGLVNEKRIAPPIEVLLDEDGKPKDDSWLEGL